MKLAFERKALFWNAQGYNIYITLNPIKSDFKGNSAKDTDIASRNLMLVDIDRTGDTVIPPFVTALKSRFRPQGPTSVWG